MGLANGFRWPMLRVCSENNGFRWPMLRVCSENARPAYRSGTHPLLIPDAVALGARQRGLVNVRFAPKATEVLRCREASLW
jgi:hypothetical protein